MCGLVPGAPSGGQRGAKLEAEPGAMGHASALGSTLPITEGGTDEKTHVTAPHQQNALSLPRCLHSPAPCSGQCRMEAFRCCQGSDGYGELMWTSSEAVIAT